MRQVLQHLLRPPSSEGRLGVHDPLGLSTGGEPALKLARVRQCAELAMKAELPLIEGAAEQSQELAPEDPAEHAHREKKTRSATDPSLAIPRRPSARDEAMHMGVLLEVLAPGVQDGQEADLGAKLLGIGGDLLQSLGGGSKRIP